MPCIECAESKPSSTADMNMTEETQITVQVKHVCTEPTRYSVCKPSNEHIAIWQQQPNPVLCLTHLDALTFTRFYPTHHDNCNCMEPKLYLNKLRSSEVEHELWQVLQLWLQVERGGVIFAIVPKPCRHPNQWTV